MAKFKIENIKELVDAYMVTVDEVEITDALEKGVDYTTKKISSIISKNSEVSVELIEHLTESAYNIGVGTGMKNGLIIGGVIGACTTMMYMAFDFSK